MTGMLRFLEDFFFTGMFVCGGATLSLWVGIRAGNPEGWLLDVAQGAVVGGLAAWMIKGGVFQNRPPWWPTERLRRRLKRKDEQ